MTDDLKLGLQLGYWTRNPPTDPIHLVLIAEDLGYDSVWCAESWGSDAFSPLAWIGARTSRIKLATGLVQISARSPAATAMVAATMDHLSGGRMILGLGVSGPQVVEGWYGEPFAKPLARTREYVALIRQILAREDHVTFEGDHYALPYDGPGSLGLGKPLKIMTHPLRADLPIYLGAEGPKNVRQTAEIADGWLPIFYSPEHQEQMYGDALAGANDGFEVACTINVKITDDLDEALRIAKMSLGFYIGGMGAEDMNFHKNLIVRMGYADEANKIQELFMAGRRDEAISAVPDELADGLGLYGPIGRIKERLQLWRDSPVTTLLVSGQTPDSLRQLAELVEI